MTPEAEEKSLDQILTQFETDRSNVKTVSEVNSYFLHLIHSQRTDETKKACRRLYEMEAKIQDYDEGRIFHSLHQHLDPSVAAAVEKAQFPGLTGRIVDCLECLFCSRWITWLQDKIITTEWLSELIATVMAIVRIISNFTDMFKDTFLTVTLMVILGGPLEVLSHPAQFTSVVVLTLSASLLVPLVTSSLHLVSNNPGMIHNFTGVRSSVVIIIHLACSFLNPLLLINRYETAKEKIRTMTKRSYQDSRVPRMIQQCRLIKTQLAEFWKIELGRYL